MRFKELTHKLQKDKCRMYIARIKNIYIYNTWKIRTLEKVRATFLYKQNNYIYKEYIPTHYMLTKKKTHYIKKRK